MIRSWVQVVVRPALGRSAKRTSSAPKRHHRKRRSPLGVFQDHPALERLQLRGDEKTHSLLLLAAPAGALDGTPTLALPHKDLSEDRPVLSPPGGGTHRQTLSFEKTESEHVAASSAKAAKLFVRDVSSTGKQYVWIAKAG